MYRRIPNPINYLLFFSDELNNPTSLCTLPRFNLHAADRRDQLEDNPIIFCSDGFAEFTGYAKDEVEGRK